MSPESLGSLLSLWSQYQRIFSCGTVTAINPFSHRARAVTRKEGVFCETFRKVERRVDRLSNGSSHGWKERFFSSSSAMCIDFFQATDVLALDTTSLAS